MGTHRGFVARGSTVARGLAGVIILAGHGLVPDGTPSAMSFVDTARSRGSANPR